MAWCFSTGASVATALNAYPCVSSSLWVNQTHSHLLMTIHGHAWQGVSTHYSDVILGAMATQITSLAIVYSTVYSGADQKKHQGSASLALCAGNSPVTGEFPAQKASNAENVSIWWRHRVMLTLHYIPYHWCIERFLLVGNKFISIYIYIESSCLFVFSFTYPTAWLLACTCT